MKILIDVTPLALSQKSGVPLFIEEMCEALLRAESDVEFLLWAPDLTHDPFPRLSNKILRQGGVPREGYELLWRYFGWAGVPRGVDVYHLPFLATPAPFHAGTRLVSTIYDLAFLHFPDISPSPHAFRGQIESAMHQAAESERIITISQATKRDIVAAFGVDEAKISVIYPGTHIEAPRADDAIGRTVFEHLKLPERYVLCVGTWEPRKNLPMLLRAWAKLRPPGVKLALCGAKGWKFAQAEALIDDLQLHDSVLSLGYVPREAMPHLYAKAQFMAFPSLYEGFGLPVLEAMICGCPVLCSDTSSLPEVAGEAALQLPPRDEDAWANALKTLLDDEALRAGMRERGLAQARKFSWEQAARETLDVYKLVAAGN